MHIFSNNQPDSLCQHTTFMAEAHSNKRTYRITIAIPSTTPPEEGFPVIYLLDANAVFGTMTEAVSLQSRRPEITGVQPAIVVGIGYPSMEPFPKERHEDFTMPIHHDQLPAHPTGGQWPAHGGAALFMQFLEVELMPYIEKNYSVDIKRQTLFGHSLGGLFVLHTLFEKPHLFSCYIAGSPSIHWNKQSLLAAEPQFTDRLQQASLSIRLLVAVGELERTHKSGMNSNAEQLANRLDVLADKGLHVQYKEYPDEGHISVLPVLISQAIRFSSGGAAIG